MPSVEAEPWRQPARARGELREVLERAEACSGERVGTGGALQRIPERTESVVGEHNCGHRDSMDQEEGSYLVLYSFPRLAQMGPSPGPELMNSPAEDSQATGRAV